MIGNLSCHVSLQSAELCLYNTALVLVLVLYEVLV